jgi:hypothetical protein
MAQSMEFLAALRGAIETYHGSMRSNPSTHQHRDPFISWFQTSFNHGNEGDLRRRVLLILVNARFDQSTLAERALENTRLVLNAGVLDREHVSLHEVPQLKTRQRVGVDRWRELFWQSLTALRELSGRISARTSWKAGDLLLEITGARIPYFGPKTARLAVRWLAEMVPEINVDMADSQVPVDSLVYRVAARLGLLDPERDKYAGPGSPGHRRIQEIAQQLFPPNPSLMDEPLWMAGRRARNGGFCHPTKPACDHGCMFASFCPRLWPATDPSVVGYSRPNNKGAAKVSKNQDGRRLTPIRSNLVIQRRPVQGLLVIVSCVAKKIWDVDASAPIHCPAGAAYVSPFFGKNRAYAQMFGEAWCVLSAKFGFLMPDENVENYNATFKLRSPDLVTVGRLKEQISAKNLDRFQRVQVLGGKEYVQRVRAAFAGSIVDVATPLAGFRIGEAMHRVQTAVDEATVMS